MSSNKGTITYGDLTILPGNDTASSGFGALTVASNTLLAGATTTINGSLGAYGSSVFHSTLGVLGVSDFYAQTNFHTTVSFLGDTTITSTTQSTSINSGALQVEGGMAVVKNTWLGGTLNTAGNTTLQGTLSVTGNQTQMGILTITNTTNSTNFSNGALVVAGGIGVASDIQSGSGNLYLGGNLILSSDPGSGLTYLASPTNSLYINQNATSDTFVNDNSSANFNVAGITNTNLNGLQVLLTTDATDFTSGALQVSGGMSVSKSLFVNQNITVAGSSNFSGGIAFTATTQSVSTSTGALVLQGGAGIAKNVYLGGILDVQSNSNAVSYLGSIAFNYNNSNVNYIQSANSSRTTATWQPLKFSPLGSSVSIMSVLSSQVTIDKTTASTSSSSGSLVVAGGTGIQGDLFVNLTSNFTGVANFSSDVYLGGNNLYLNAFNTQTDGLIFSNTQSTGGPFLFGLNGGALGTTSGSTVSALTWDTNQSVQILGTTDTTSTTTGALTVSGGVGIANSVSIGTSIFLKSTSFTSNGNNVFINANSSNVNLRNTAGSISGEFESTNLLFNFKTINVTSPVSIPPFVTFQIDKTSGYVYVYQTDNATGANTGSFQVSGGASFSKDVWFQGNINVSGSINSTGGSPVSFDSTDDSTSPTTGAVTIAGGLGVAKNIYLGGTLHVVNTTDSTDSTTGSFVTSGGAGIASDLFIGGNVNIGSTLTTNGSSTFYDQVNINTTYDSTSTSSGGLLVTGGIGLTGNLYMSGQQFIQNTTVSSSSSTGSLVISGGVGISGNTFTSGTINITNTTNSSSNSTGSLITAGGAAIAKNLFVGGNVNVTGTLDVSGNITSTGGTVTFTNTVDATAPTSASVVVSGGLGVVKALYVGSTINSTSSSTGGLVLSGGLGVASNFYLGGNQTLSGTNPLLSFNNSGVAPPTFTTVSNGTKIVLSSVVDATHVDYAFGIDSNTLWSSIPQNSSSYFFTYYGGTTPIYTMDGMGNIVSNATTNSTSSSTGAFITNGGAGIAKDLYVGGKINVNTTAYFGGTITANGNYIGTGTITTSNVTNSTSSSSGSITTSGGLGVALDTNLGGGLTVSSTSVFNGTLRVNGTSLFANTTDSGSISTGSVVVNGGVGIAKNLNVGGNTVFTGNATVTGNFYVNGTTTTVNTQTLNTTENVVVVNNAPSGTAYGGLGIKRYQPANDTSLGDVVNGDPPDYQGTSTNTGSSNTIYLDSGASNVDNYYNGYWVWIYSGTGDGQVRKIKSYDGTTKVATIYDSADESSSGDVPVDGLDFTTTPDNTSQFKLFSAEYIVAIWDETNDEYVIGGTPLNPSTHPTFPLRSTISVHAQNLKLDDTLQVDTINEKTLNAGVTIEGVVIKDNTIDSGLLSINGSLVDVTSTVQLIDNNINATVTIPGTQTYGAYTILVCDTVNSGTSAVFQICGSTSHGGSVFRAASCIGANGEHLTITWSQSDYPQLQYMNLPSNGTGLNISYYVRVTRVV